MITQTAAAMSEALSKGEVTSTELTQAHLDRIAGVDSSVKAFLHIDTEGALAQAAQVDADRSAGKKLHPLAGIPLALKDVLTQEGIPTTAGSKILQGWKPQYDSTVVSKIKDAGIVILGKTNMDEFAMGSSNENSAYGPTLNPWNLERVPGGSSGGSAAAVAAGLAPIATGTDTGGSIRQPAAFCGLTGLKPSYGRVSRYGMIAYASSLDQAGPMGKNAKDCSLIMNAIAGHDPKDSSSLEKDNEDYCRHLGKPWLDKNNLVDKPLQGLRIGVPKEYFSDGLDGEVRTAVENALRAFEGLGAVCVDVSLPKTELSIPTYYVLAPAEASSNLSRYDGVRYGHRSADYKNLAQMYERSRAEGFGAEVKRRILIGTYVLSQGYYDAYYLQAQKIRRIIAQDFQNTFLECDVLMGPVAPGVAWKFSEKSSDPVQMYLEDIYTLSPNLAGLPAMSIPCGCSTSKMPIGLQIIGNYFSEARMLQIADYFQQASNWHLQQSPLLAPPASNGEVS